MGAVVYRAGEGEIIAGPSSVTIKRLVKIPVARSILVKV